MTILLISSLSIILLVLLSYLVEALRPQPSTPASALWDVDMNYEYTKIHGNKVRYIKTGSGPALILLHTLRTQLDMWQKVIPQLSTNFTIYAMDHIGHGFSDIPKTDYTPDMFLKNVEGFLENMQIEDSIVVGESIGGTLGLMLAAKQNKRVKQVIAIDSYEYDKGRGVYRSSLIGRLLFSNATVPIVGATFWRLRALPIFSNIILGGIMNKKNFPKPLIKEMNAVGNRKGHYQAFINLISHFPKWESVNKSYGEINIPTLLLFAEHDWSTQKERAHLQNLIPKVQVKMLPNSGHFASLDASDLIIKEIMGFTESMS